MKIAALMLTGSDFYATRARACAETWLPAFDAFQIHSFESCDFLPITKAGVAEGKGSCFDKRLDGLRLAPDADWYLCASCDNYIWAENLRAALDEISSESPALVGAFMLNQATGVRFSLVLDDGCEVFFPSGGAGYCLNRRAFELIVDKLDALRDEWIQKSAGKLAEDVFIGWAADKLGISKIDHAGFHPANPSRGWGLKVAPEKLISLHWLDEAQIRQLHAMTRDELKARFRNKISLCMICGNEESVILRCLESAKDAFDELCLVSAIGNREADKTLYVAEKWAAENGKDFKAGRYENRFDLPHVDDFGAARNQAFALASGDWQLWLDCDDYLDAINCARIREAVSVVGPEVSAIFASYIIEKNGAEIVRERLIRTGHGRWKNPIHETCVVEGMKLNCQQIQVFHGDHRHKHESSAARNATILRRTIEDAPRHYFYLHCELKMMKDADAAKYGHAALALLDASMAEERYVVLLNMSELEPERRESYLHEAARIQPHRREAFAYLCKSALIDGRTSDAVSYFRMMDALPMPSPVPWTHQGQWYGWARHMLRIDCLRACGQDAQADAENLEHLKDPEYAENVKD